MPGRGIVHQDYQSHSDTLHTSWENLPSSNMLSKIGHFRYICLCVYCTCTHNTYYININIYIYRWTSLCWEGQNKPTLIPKPVTSFSGWLRWSSIGLGLPLSSTHNDTHLLSLCSTHAGRLRRQNSFWPVTFSGASPLWKVQINVRRKWRRFTQDRSLKITQDHLRGVAPSEVCRKVRFQCAFVILPKVGMGKAW